MGRRRNGLLLGDLEVILVLDQAFWSVRLLGVMLLEYSGSGGFGHWRCLMVVELFFHDHESEMHCLSYCLPALKRQLFAFIVHY